MILVDTNVLLDLFQRRMPHFVPAVRLFDRVVRDTEAAAIAAHTLPTLEYLIKRTATRTAALDAVDWVLAHLTIIPVDRPAFVRARSLGWRDFEDAIVAAAAEAAGCRVIVTRNVRDFSDRPVPALTPPEFLLTG